MFCFKKNRVLKLFDKEKHNVERVHEIKEYCLDLALFPCEPYKYWSFFIQVLTGIQFRLPITSLFSVRVFKWSFNVFFCSSIFLFYRMCVSLYTRTVPYMENNRIKLKKIYKFCFSLRKSVLSIFFYRCAT